MSDRNTSLWKVEEFIISNLKEVSVDGDTWIVAHCSMGKFIEKLEEKLT